MPLSRGLERSHDLAATAGVGLGKTVRCWLARFEAGTMGGSEVRTPGRAFDLVTYVVLQGSTAHLAVERGRRHCGFAEVGSVPDQQRL